MAKCGCPPDTGRTVYETKVIETWDQPILLRTGGGSVSLTLVGYNGATTASLSGETIKELRRVLKEASKKANNNG